MTAPAAQVSELLDSAFKGDVYRMGALLDQHAGSGLTVNSCDYDKRSALHLAASEGALECAKLLVKKGADVNAKDRWNGTPLDDAVRQNNNDVMTYLVENGGKTGDEGEVVKRLFTAIEKGDADAVNTLIKSGVDVKSADYDMRTPLHVAVAGGNATIIEALHKAGGDINAMDNFGLTPLGEAERRHMRTGENKIRDLLVGLGGSKVGGEAKEERPSSKRFIIGVGLAQILFVILFATCTEYDKSTEDPVGSPLGIKTTYGMFQDVHVMIFIGFGFLMTFLRKYGYSSVGLNFLVASFVIQWHMLVGGFMHQAFDEEREGGFHKIGINLTTLLLADFASAAVLITFGALLGKVTATQLLLLGFLEIIFFALNENILLKIGIMDVGGSIIVHIFGAYFGLAASFVLTKKPWKEDSNNAACYHSDLFAMVGTTFLFVFWPSFVASPAGPYDQERAIIATLLSLVGSTVTAFVMSQLMRGGEFCMVDVQNATLAGGVAIGTAANLVVLSPAEALAIGIASGILSVLGYTVIQPNLQKYIGLHDTCGVNNLHGMPGILAAIVSAIVCGTSKSDHFPSKEHQMAVYGPRNIGESDERTAGEQAGYQILCLVVSFSMAVVCGLISALAVKFVDRLGETSAFVDSASWEVPELEIPFYFDHRGEINRDMLRAGAKGPVAATTADGASAQVVQKSTGSKDVIPNELLNTKLDLLLQARAGA